MTAVELFPQAPKNTIEIRDIQKKGFYAHHVLAIGLMFFRMPGSPVFHTRFTARPLETVRL